MLEINVSTNSADCHYHAQNSPSNTKFLQYLVQGLACAHKLYSDDMSSLFQSIESYTQWPADWETSISS